MKPLLLFCIRNREPVFDQDDARAHPHSFEFRAGPEKLAVILVRAKAHDPFNAGPVVPAAIQQDDFTRSRQVSNVALEIPLCPLALGRCRQGDDAANATAEMLRDALYDATFTGRVAAFEDNDDFETFVLHPGLQLHQFQLQADSSSSYARLPIRLAFPRFSGSAGQRHRSARLGPCASVVPLGQRALCGVRLCACPALECRRDMG